MPWKIVDGQPQRVSRQEVATEISPPEVSVEVVVDLGEFTCLICGKEYKTERGLDNHLDTHEE